MPPYIITVIGYYIPDCTFKQKFFSFKFFKGIAPKYFSLIYLSHITLKEAARTISILSINIVSTIRKLRKTSYSIRTINMSFQTGNGRNMLHSLDIFYPYRYGFDSIRSQHIIGIHYENKFTFSLSHSDIDCAMLALVLLPDYRYRKFDILARH